VLEPHRLGNGLFSILIRNYQNKKDARMIKASREPSLNWRAIRSALVQTDDLDHHAQNPSIRANPNLKYLVVVLKKFILKDVPLRHDD